MINYIKRFFLKKKPNLHIVQVDNSNDMENYKICMSTDKQTLTSLYHKLNSHRFIVFNDNKHKGQYLLFKKGNIDNIELYRFVEFNYDLALALDALDNTNDRNKYFVYTNKENQRYFTEGKLYKCDSSKITNHNPFFDDFSNRNKGENKSDFRLATIDELIKFFLNNELLYKKWTPKPKEWILCRDSLDEGFWRLCQFSNFDSTSEYPYHVCGNYNYKYAIPYEGNENKLINV